MGAGADGKARIFIAAVSCCQKLNVQKQMGVGSNGRGKKDGGRKTKGGK